MNALSLEDVLLSQGQRNQMAQFYYFLNSSETIDFKSLQTTQDMYVIDPDVQQKVRIYRTTLGYIVPPTSKDSSTLLDLK